MSAIDKVEIALRAAKEKGIKISPGCAAFTWGAEELPLSCSGFGALILYHNLRDGSGIAKTGWWDELSSKLGVTSWWLRRFYCGFELGRVVYVKTQKKTDVFYFDAKGKKHYLKEDSVSKALIKLRKRLASK